MKLDWSDFIALLTDEDCEAIIREYEDGISGDTILRRKTSEWCIDRVFYFDNRISDKILLECYSRMYNHFKGIADGYL